jgi:DNA-binding transcriptional LysR family regulator
LRYFVAVAEELHFGRAAARLQMAQPPLSQQVQQLESIVGTALFVRTSRSVALTAAGQAFLARSRQILATVRDDVIEAGRIGRGEQGRLDIGFVSSAILLGVPDQVRRLQQRFPQVQVRLHEGFTTTLIEHLRRGEIDLAVVRDGEPTAGLDATDLATEPFVAVLPTDHPRARDTTLGAGALRHDPFVFFPRSAGERAYQRNLQPCLEVGFAPRIVQEGSSWPTILHLVAAGLGVTLAPAAATLGAPPSVRVVPLTGTEATSTVQILRRAQDGRVTVQRFGEQPSENR